jgi:carbamate kinase
MTRPRLVAALGGNALARRGEPITVEAQRRNAALAASALAPLARTHDLVVTHGNGPKVGMLLMESGAAGSGTAAPLDVLGAESEGMIGYLLEQALRAELPGREVAVVVTQTVVDPHDPALRVPSKPIGPLYGRADAVRRGRERGLAVAADTGGWRLVVPSPEPVRLLEEATISMLVERGVLVIASGGGGVPVTLDGSGRPHGVEAVVDKDLAAVTLARLVRADLLLLLTDVDAVYRGFGSPDARRVERLSPAAARELIAAGVAATGSMAPKLAAAARFAAAGGLAVICALEDARRALDGNVGTRVEPEAVPGTPMAPGPKPQRAEER